MLGHELRNPLAPILTALQLLQLRGVDGRRARARPSSSGRCGTWSGSSTTCSTSRASRAARSSCERERVELADVVAQAIEMASPLLEQRSHDLERRRAAHGLIVDADAARLAQVVSQPADQRREVHASRGGAHLGHGGGRRRARSCCASATPASASTPEMLPRIFDLFVQEPPDARRRAAVSASAWRSCAASSQLHGGRWRHTAAVGHGQRVRHPPAARAVGASAASRGARRGSARSRPDDRAACSSSTTTTMPRRCWPTCLPHAAT